MFRKPTFVLALALLVLAAGPASALFENTVVSPRARGMGESAVAVSDPAYAAFHNPGQLGQTGRSQAAASYVRPFSLDFTDFLYAGCALPISPQYGSLGLGISHFAVNYQDVSLLQETQVALAYGLRLYEDYHSRIDAGFSVNMFSVNLGETVTGLDPGQDTVLGLDLGFALTLRKRTRLGFLVENLNHPNIGVDEEELPQRLLAGISYEPYDGVITTFEFKNELGQQVGYHGGLEMILVPGFALRAGVTTNPNKVTAGFGYGIKGIAVNYGFATGGGTLDSTHQFGLNFAWGGEAP